MGGPEKTRPEDKPGYDETKDLGVKAAEGRGPRLFDGTQKSIDDNWEMWPKKDMKITWSLVKSPTDDSKVLMTNGGKTLGHARPGHQEEIRRTSKPTLSSCCWASVATTSIEGYANSGVYLQNRYELQIESPKGKAAADPYNWKIGPHGIGAFCMERVPDANAWRENGEWHAFHFTFSAARWEGDKMVEPARATVWWNGVKVHENVPIKHANGGIKVSPALGGLKLQEHGQDVRFRNVWIRELNAE